MNAIDLMIEEHDNILEFIGVVRKACCGILEGKHIAVEDFRDMITFARTYADRHHHGKEERFLFNDMVERLGELAVNLVQHGMLVEHDMGRFHMSELEKALDSYKMDGGTETKLKIITNASAWTDLLQRHIEKENGVVYPFAQRSLSAEVLRRIDERAEEFEREEAAAREAALKILAELKEKYPE